MGGPSDLWWYDLSRAVGGGSLWLPVEPPGRDSPGGFSMADLGYAGG